MTTPTPTHHLRDDVHAVAIDGGVVFLDLRRDTYACVPGIADRMEVDEAGRVRAIVDPNLASELREAGLLSDEGRPSPPRWPIGPVTTSAMSGPFETLRWVDPFRVAVAMVDLAGGYWRQPLAKLAKWATEGATEPGNDAPDRALLEVVDSFHRWSPYVAAVVDCYLALTAGRSIRKRGDRRRADP